MIKFFTNIRKKLLAEDKTTNYEMFGNKWISSKIYSIEKQPIGKLCTLELELAQEDVATANKSIKISINSNKN